MVATDHIPGNERVLTDKSPAAMHGVAFEDDGETGYFYALDLLPGGEQQIVDAVHIYDVRQLTNRNLPSVLSVRWSADGTKSCLVINGQPHAVFDFKARRWLFAERLSKLTARGGNQLGDDYPRLGRSCPERI